MKLLNISNFIVILLLINIYAQHLPVVSSKENLHKINNFIEKVKVPFTYSVKIIPNPKINSKIKTKHLNCNEKTGVLNYLKSKKKNILTVSPTYISLITKSINFFTTNKKSTLFDSINLNSIQRITQIYQGTFCFDIVSNSKKNSNKITTLCAKNLPQLNEWISSILNFKKCEIQVNTVLQNKIDINTTNKATLNEDKLKGLFYNGQNKSIGKRRNGLVKVINNTNLNNILKTIQFGSLQEQSLRRRMIGKLKLEENKNRNNFKNEETIREMMEQKSARTKENEIKLINLEHKNKEARLIKNARIQIKKLKVLFYLIFRSKN